MAKYFIFHLLGFGNLFISKSFEFFENVHLFVGYSYIKLLLMHEYITTVISRTLFLFKKCCKLLIYLVLYNDPLLIYYLYLPLYYN